MRDPCYESALAGLRPGETLKLIATDPGAIKDIEAFCAQTGHQMLALVQNGRSMEFFLRKQ